jgi:hypothetical protein
VRRPLARRIGSAVLAFALGCGLLPGSGPWDAPPPPAYQPDRRDYATFRAAWPELHEPNYLPFMAHQLSLGAGHGDALVFCRWDDSAMPLPVYVATPVIPDTLQNEFAPRDPALYVKAVERALATWEREMDGLVRFRRVALPGEARISIVMHGEQAPVMNGEQQVLGSTRLGGACDVEGWDPDAERLRVHFQVEALQIYVADEFGLLAPDQVEWVALHELGHVLGMRGHSPIPADLMYEVVRDRVLVRDGLSAEDVNSFLSLYSLPNGSVFTEVDSAYGPERGEAPPPTGPPMLALAPHVDAIHGFRLHLPHGWQRVETEQGVAAVDGVTWDYSASYQVMTSRQSDIEAYLDRYGAWYARRGQLVNVEDLVVNGHRALQGMLLRSDEASVEEITLIDSGDGRVVVVTAECARDHYEVYAPWFDAVLASLEIDPEGQP